MTVAYNKSSPYYTTKLYGNFLDLWEPRTFPKETDDVKFTINKIYQYRPDLLSFDLYGNANLWWVFCARNPNVLQDPIWDFRENVTIYLPKKKTLEQALGL